MIADLEYIADRLSLMQWEYLTDHVDGSRIVVRNAGEEPTRQSLLVRKLIRNAPASSLRPTHTTITELGRGVMAVILGRMADKLKMHGHYDLTKIGYGRLPVETLRKCVIETENIKEN
jgi:hypothetical protein